MRPARDGTIGTMAVSRPYSGVLVAGALALLATLAAAEPAVVPLTLPSGKVLQVEVMVNDEDRQMGLMFRPSLPEDHGMLFVFDTSDFHGIWMKNCKFPIDILWLDEGRHVVHVTEAVPPCKAEPCPVYQPMRRASYVVELNAGQARREKAVVGAEIRFELPAPPR
jgi:uncharacterized membrane protein (UPF0127 family)